MAINVRLYKLPSKKLRDAKFNYNTTPAQALKEGNVITSGNSQLVEWIYKLRGIDSNKLGEYVGQIKKDANILESQVEELTRQAKQYEKDGKFTDARKTRNEIKTLNKQIKEKYEQVSETLFMDEILKVQFSTSKDIEKIVEKGLFVNGVEYVYLITKGDEDVTFIKKDLYKEFSEKINADRNVNVPQYSAKLSAYKSLTTTGSTLVTSPQNIIVIDDCNKEFFADYLQVNEKIEHRREIVERAINDGASFCMPHIAEQWTKDLGHEGVDSAFQVRYLWTKGIIFPFDYKRWITENGGKTTVTDLWGHERDIMSSDLILTKSMLKLWGSYDSMEQWIESANKYDYHWRVGLTSKKSKVGYSNYQQLLPLAMNTEQQCREFVQYEMSHLRDVMGKQHHATYLYLNGVSNTKESVVGRVKSAIENGEADIALALMIEPDLVKDRHVQIKVKRNLDGTRKDMKYGHCMLGEDSSFQIIIPDPIALVQHLCGLEPVGFLDSYEIYSKTHMDKNIEEALAFRSPQLIENNTVRVKIARPTDDVKKYLEYLDDVYIIDSCSLINESMCGFDFDGDKLQLTTNKVMMDAHTPQLPVRCAGKSSDPIIIDSEEPLIESAKLGMGKNTPKIGKVINDATQIFAIRGRFDKDSEEYKELTERLIQMQKISQSVIDAKKTADWFDAPEIWFKRDAIELLPEEEQEMAHKLCADKKPYFFQVDDADLSKRYKEYLERVGIRTAMRWGISAEDFLAMDTRDMNDEQRKFYNDVIDMSPINMDDTSVMYTFTRTVEKELKELSHSMSKDIEDCRHLLKFENVTCDDYNSLLEDVEKEINSLFDERERKTRNLRKVVVSNEEEEKVSNLVHNINAECNTEFRRKIIALADGNVELAINALIDVLYDNKKRESLVLWDVFSTELVMNLLKKKDYYVTVIYEDETGNLAYKGKNYSEEKVLLEF